MKTGYKICSTCKARFLPWNTTQRCCSPKCAIEFQKTKKGKQHVDKSRRKEHAERKKAIRRKGDVVKLTQKAFNAYIRERDKHKPCISCGRAWNDTKELNNPYGHYWDAGHFRTVGACPELRFEELNVHKQCVGCNRDKSGHQAAYRQRLLERIGEKSLAWLEGPHQSKNYSIEDLDAIRKLYRQRLRELQQEVT